MVIWDLDLCDVEFHTAVSTFDEYAAMDNAYNLRVVSWFFHQKHIFSIPFGYPIILGDILILWWSSVWHILQMADFAHAVSSKVHCNKYQSANSEGLQVFNFKKW